MDSGPSAPTRIAFLDFELLPAQRLLLRAGRPLPSGARAYDLLVLLASRPGEVVSKRALMAGAWPHTVVVEANLRVQIAALRKLLGDAGSAIVNVAGRGYAFTAVPAPQAVHAAATGSVGRAAVVSVGVPAWRCVDDPLTARMPSQSSAILVYMLRHFARLLQKLQHRLSWPLNGACVHFVCWGGTTEIGQWQGVSRRLVIVNWEVLQHASVRGMYGIRAASCRCAK